MPKVSSWGVGWWWVDLVGGGWWVTPPFVVPFFCFKSKTSPNVVLHYSLSVSHTHQIQTNPNSHTHNQHLQDLSLRLSVSLLSGNVMFLSHSHHSIDSRMIFRYSILSCIWKRYYELFILIFSNIWFALCDHIYSNGFSTLLFWNNRIWFWEWKRHVIFHIRIIRMIMGSPRF